MYVTAYSIGFCVIVDRCSCKCCVFYDIWMVTTHADSRRQIV